MSVYVYLRKGSDPIRKSRIGIYNTQAKYGSEQLVGLAVLTVLSLCEWQVSQNFMTMLFPPDDDAVPFSRP